MNTLRLFLVTLFFTVSAFAADPPPVRKTDAKRVLEMMKFTEVTIITVQQGIDSKGKTAPIYANVVAFGTRDAKHHVINQTLYYDEDLGWFYFEVYEKLARLWTKDRYQEIKPWSTW
jgi:hypothetical protein